MEYFRGTKITVVLGLCATNGDEHTGEWIKEDHEALKEEYVSQATVHADPQGIRPEDVHLRKSNTDE